MENAFDLVVIGGGINGAGVARDAAGRGLKVALVERDDLAAHTSSASSKLVHGGIRYLEQYEFGLVRKALKEREVLMRIAPHIVWPMRFVLPHDARLRPAWMIRIGLALYDWLDLHRSLPASRGVRLDRAPFAGMLASNYVCGFEYSDCWVDDARLVVLNAVDSAARGATILTRHECAGIERDGDLWRVSVRGDGEDFTLSAGAIVNAAGPWVEQVMAMARGAAAAEAAPGHVVRLVKGSHIVVPRIHELDRAFIFQNDDRRIVFALPYEQDFTLIGTTDADPPPLDAMGEVAISSAETDYLIDVANRHFARTIARRDIVWSYAGVRSLYDDGSADAAEVTRNYVLKHDGGGDVPQAVHIIGGKITTYRRLAEDVLALLAPEVDAGRGDWTGEAPLPGGTIGAGGPGAYAGVLASRYPRLPPAMLARFARSYGSASNSILGDAECAADLGTHFGSELYEVEVSHLVENEFARTADDIVWRRSKLGLRLSADEVARLDAYLAAAVGRIRRRAAP
jgi:glycerol-3-phosphate dehydrogenase